MMKSVDIPQNEVRNCIKSYMQAQKLTYQDLADRMGLSLQTVNNYMSTKALTEKTVGKFAAALEYPLDLLLRGERYFGPDTYADFETRLKKLEEEVRILKEIISSQNR